jgi:hypothetical protein
MVMVDRLPLSRRRSPGRRRGLLSLPFFCRIEGRVYAKFPKFKKKLLFFNGSCILDRFKEQKSLNVYEIQLLTLFLSSSVVERSAVNRLVVGSNPTWGDLYFFRTSCFDVRNILVIVYINTNSPKRDKDVLTLLINGNNGLFKILKKKIEKLRSKNL